MLTVDRLTCSFIQRALILSALTLAGCSQSFPLGRKGEPDPQSDQDGGAASKGADSGGIPYRPAFSTPKKTNDDGKGELTQILEQCGFPDAGDKLRLVTDRTLRTNFSNQVEVDGGTYLAQINAQMAITTSQAKAIIATGYDVTKIDVGLKDPEPIAAMVKERLEYLVGTREAELIAPDAHGEAFLSYPEWQNIYCTMSVAKKMTVKMGKYVTTITFNPALPLMVAPQAAASRYVGEIGMNRSFAGIEAKIVETTNPLLKVGQVVMGDVKIEQIIPTRSEPSGEALAGDSAYRMTAQFGTPQEMLALGLKPVTDYYISFKTRSYTGIVIDDKSSFATDRLTYFVEH